MTAKPAAGFPATFNLVARVTAPGHITLAAEYQAPTKDGLMAVYTETGILSFRRKDASADTVRDIYKDTIGDAHLKAFADFAAAVDGARYLKTGEPGLSGEAGHFKRVMQAKAIAPAEDFKANIESAIGPASVITLSATLSVLRR